MTYLQSDQRSQRAAIEGSTTKLHSKTANVSFFMFFGLGDSARSLNCSHEHFLVCVCSSAFTASQQVPESEPKMGVSGGMIAAGALGATALGVTAIAAPFVAPAFRRVCIPYVPASDQQVTNVRALLRRCEAPIAPLVDLGSGDGRIVSGVLLVADASGRAAGSSSSSSNSGGGSSGAQWGDTCAEAAAALVVVQRWRG